MNRVQTHVLREQLAIALFSDGAFLTRDSDHPLVVTRVSERGFLLQLHEKTPKAPLSPYFFNIRVAENKTRPGTLTESTVRLATECMYRLAVKRKLQYSGVTGVPNAGDPLAQTFVTFDQTKACFKLLKRERNGKRTIEAIEHDAPQRHSTILLIDDLISTARSKFLAIDLMKRKYSLQVTDVLVIVDRQQGGCEELTAQGIGLHSVFTTMELLDIYYYLGYISHELNRDIRAYIESQ